MSPHDLDRDLLSKCAALLPRLSHDELEAMHLLLTKVVAGHREYGPTELDTDPRDFVAEFLDEQIDATFYACVGAIRARRK